jgi:hypothetical protein
VHNWKYSTHALKNCLSVVLRGKLSGASWAIGGVMADAATGWRGSAIQAGLPAAIFALQRTDKITR